MEKLLLITSEFPPLPGGIGNHAYWLARYLSKHNYKVSVLTDYRDPQADRDFDPKQDFEVHRISRNGFTYLHRLFRAWSLVKKQQTVICSGKFSLWTGAFLKLFFPKKKYIAVLHGSELLAGNRFLKKWTSWSLKRFNHCIAVSEFTKRIALAQTGQLEIKVINNGVLLPDTTISHQAPKELHLITVGNVTYRKGQQQVIQALSTLQRVFPEVHYHCVGIPTEKKSFVQLADSLGVSDCITWYGAVSEARKMEILKGASIFVMLSQTTSTDMEGFGIAVIEANALGLPAVGSKNTGIADAISHGYSGFLIDSENPEELLAAVQKIVENYELFSQQAQQWSTRFDWNRVVLDYLKVIQS